jgi:hypothetical protein
MGNCSSTWFLSLLLAGAFCIFQSMQCPLDGQHSALDDARFFAFTVSMSGWKVGPLSVAALSVVAYAAVLPFETAQSRPKLSDGPLDSGSSPWSAWAFPPGTWLAGLELGFWNTVGTALQVREQEQLQKSANNST